MPTKDWYERLKIIDGRMDRTEVPEDECSQCGNIEELRPYGPNQSWICYDCGSKDPVETAKQMNNFLFGVKH